MDNIDNSGKTLQQYPCDYQFKVFGQVVADDDFMARVHAAVNCVTVVPLDACKQRPSSKGGYVCVSVAAYLHNEQQRQDIYRQLQQLEGLKYLL